jgi:aromatic-amino-acid transaminase
MSPFFEQIPLAPADPIFGLVAAFTKDPRPNKISLVVGYYCDETGQTPVMGAVRETEIALTQHKISKEYLPIEGNPLYLSLIGQLVFGPLWIEVEPRLVKAQTVGGTGALRQMADLFYAHIGKNVSLSDPTWANHRGIFTAAQFAITTYPYYDVSSHQIPFDRVIASLEQLPSHSLVVLHASCHNPTGADFTPAQWEQISDLCRQKGLFPLFDMAYQGFGQGVEQDAAAIRLFVKKGHELAVCYSCAKNFSLYGERVGALFILTSSSKWKETVSSQIRQLIRRNYSNPPRHGAEIVAHILSTETLTKKWQQELTNMRLRMTQTRRIFAQALTRKMPHTSWSFVEKGHGLFCYTGLSQEAVQKLQKEQGIYMPYDGRINITALNHNLETIVDAIAQV